MLFEGAGSRLAGWLGLAAGFGLLGALCDQFHVQSGLLSYPDTWLWDQAAWVPLNFAVLLTGLVALTIPLGRLAAARGVPEPGPRRLAADFAWFVGAYALSGLVAPDAPGALAVTYFAVWVVRIAFREDRALLYPFGVALALAGCLVEAVEIEFGWRSGSRASTCTARRWHWTWRAGWMRQVCSGNGARPPDARFAAASRSSRKSGCAIAARASPRWRTVLPCSSAAPCSVTTTST